MRENFPNLYKFYRNNIIKHAIIKSMFICSFGLLFCSLLTFIFFPKYFIITPVIFILVTILGSMFNYLRNRPTDKNFARALDELGLSQRVITMNQYKDDDSLIARVQRANAVEHINKIDCKQLKVAVKAYVIIILVFMILFGFSGITAAALANSGIIDSGQQIIIDNVPGLKNEYEIMYEVEGDGCIEGNFFQIVEAGEDAAEVWAVPGHDWFFIEWSDGLKDPYRHDLNVHSSIHVFAIFAEIDLDFADPEFELDPELDMDRPVEELNNLANGTEPSNGDPSNGAGGKYEDNNQVIDGETYYGDNVWRNAYEDAVEELRSSSRGDTAEFVDKYFGIIQK